MKFTKRITSLLLVFVLASASLFTYVQAADFTDVTENDQYYNAINELVAAGIINGYEDGTFKPANTITRAEFSKILAVASAPMGYTFTAAATTFTDIPDMNADHGWAVPYIQYAVSTKAVNGYEDGTFRPGNPVTYGEAVKMIVCTLGYGPVVDTTLEPWYQGYLNVAQQIGLNKLAVSTGDTPASRGIVAQLTNNMFDCPVLVQTGVDQNGQPVYSTDTESNFGDEKDNATSEEGVLLGITDFSIDGKAVGRNQINIDGNIYTLGNGINMDALKADIGYKVSYSYSGNGSKKEIVKINRITGYNSEIVITPEQIDTINASSVEYFENASSKRDEPKKIRYSSPYVIYNGTPVNPTSWAAFSSTHLKLVEDDFINGLNNGTIKLISNDASDTDAEVLVIENYTTYFAKTPSGTTTVTLYDKNPSVTGLNDIEISEDDVTDVKVVTSPGGKASTGYLSSIKLDTVVSIAVPYGAAAGHSADNTKIIVSTAKQTGDVKGISTDDDTIQVGSNTYKLSAYYKKLVAYDPTAYSVDVGDNATFYFDYMGKITSVKKNESSDPYGLVIAYGTGGEAFSNTVTLKIIDENGRQDDYTVNPSNITLTVNGTGNSSTPDAVVTALKSASKITTASSQALAVPVIFKETNKLISSIQILDQVPTASTATINTPGDKFKYDESGDLFVHSDANKFTMTKSGNDATKVFIVPASRTDFSRYSKNSSNYFEDNGLYYVSAYEMNGTNAKIVVCYLDSLVSTTPTISPASPVYVVKANTGITDNARKLEVERISSADDKTSYETNTESDVLSIASTLTAGDLVRFAVDSVDKKICDIEIVYDASSKTLNTSNTDVTEVIDGHHLKVGTSKNAEYYQAYYGTVLGYTEGSQITVMPEIYSSAALDNTQYKSFTISSPRFYRIYKNAKNEEIVESTVGSEIKTYTEFNGSNSTVASKVVVIVMNGSVAAIYIDQR